MEAQIRGLQKQISSLKLTPTAPRPRARRRRAQQNGASRAGATATIKHTEMLVEVKTDDKGVFYSSQPFLIKDIGKVLKAYASIYDTYKIRSVVVAFHSAASAAKNGSVSFGYDFFDGTTPTEKSQVLILSPHYSGHASRNSTLLRLPSNIVRPDLVRDPQKDTPFSVLIASDGEKNTVLGHLEITYDLVFAGIRP